eukprot:6485264-Amphidinium_carterae.1
MPTGAGMSAPTPASANRSTSRYGPRAAFARAMRSEHLTRGCTDELCHIECVFTSDMTSQAALCQLTKLYIESSKHVSNEERSQAKQADRHTAATQKHAACTPCGDGTQPHSLRPEPSPQEPPKWPTEVPSKNTLSSQAHSHVLQWI